MISSVSRWTSARMSPCDQSRAAPRPLEPERTAAVSLPPPGTPTQPETAGYMANAYVRMRHPDFDTLRGMLDDVGRQCSYRRIGANGAQHSVHLVLLGTHEIHVVGRHGLQMQTLST